MNKWMFRFASILVAIGLLVGCAQEDNNVTPNDSSTEEAAIEHVMITISTDKGEETVTEKEVTIKENDLLLDVLKENFEIEEEGGFISSIEGIEQDADTGKYWIYTVNNEEVTVGAAAYELSADDQVNFDLQAWE